MKTLTDIDILAVPDVTVQLVRGCSRVQLVCGGADVATELWMYDLAAIPARALDVAPSLRWTGGVDVHHAQSIDLADSGPDPCDVLPGGQCWSYGATLAALPTREAIDLRTWIAGGDSAAVIRWLAQRHQRASENRPSGGDAE